MGMSEVDVEGGGGGYVLPEDEKRARDEVTGMYVEQEREISEEGERLRKVAFRVGQLRDAYGDKEGKSGMERDLCEVLEDLDWLRFEVKAKNHQLELMEAEVQMAHKLVLDQVKDRKKIEEELSDLRGQLGMVIQQVDGDGVRELLKRKRTKSAGRSAGKRGGK